MLHKLRWCLLLLFPLLVLPSSAAKLSPSSTTLIVGQSSTLYLSRFKGTPTLANSNASIVSAILVGSKVMIKANAAGRATLSITDSSGTVSSRVTVKSPMTVTPTSLSLLVGQAAQLTVSDAFGRISVKNSKSDVARSSLSGNRITVTGRKIGSALLTVNDGKTKVIVQTSVTTAAPPPTSEVSPNGRLLASNCFQCHGTYGSGGFDRIHGSSDLLSELREFASGKEDSDGIMAAHTMGYTDAQMKAIADYLATE